jgi:hypothetical protein
VTDDGKRGVFDDLRTDVGDGVTDGLVGARVQSGNYQQCRKGMKYRFRL